MKPASRNKKQLRTIKASRIELTDSEGRTRIILDAGTKDGYASICLFAPDGKSIQISNQPEGGIYIQICGRRCTSHIDIGVSGDESGHIVISGKKGQLGTLLGEEPGTSTHRLLLFKRGKHFWNTPTGKTKQQKGRTI